MKNLVKLFGIIALVAVIGLSMAGCEVDVKDDKATLFIPPPPSGGTGTVKITNASTYNADSYVYADISDAVTYDAIAWVNSLARNATYTFSNVPAGRNIQVWVEDSNDNLYYSSAFSLTAGQTRSFTYNGTSIVEVANVSGSGTQSNPYSLISGVWADGTVSSASSEDWYSFYLPANSMYYIWWNDHGQGNGTKTGDIDVRFTFPDGTTTNAVDDGWTSPYYVTSSASGGTVKIRVRPYLGLSNYTGTYAIAYRTTNTRPTWTNY